MGGESPLPRGRSGRWWWSGHRLFVGQFDVAGHGVGVVGACSAMAVGSHGVVSPSVHRDWRGRRPREDLGENKGTRV